MATITDGEHSIVWAVIVVMLIVGNVLWYTVKFVLRKNGFPVSFIWHGRDLPNLFRLARREVDPGKRIRYSFLFLALCVWLVIFVLLAGYLLSK